MNWQTIGFKAQKKYLEQAAKADNLAHAYLFTGNDMIGKQMFARDLYALVNGREATVNEPDFKLISPRVEEDETKIYIEDIRDLKSFAFLRPYYGPYKFIIINDADRLTPEASNALLKVLEEPTPKTILILISSKSRMLLPTITSRCQHINFMSHDEAALIEYMDKLKLSKGDHTLLISMAHGRIGWLQWATEHIKEIQESLGDLDKVLKGTLADRMAYAKKIYERETYPTTLANWMYWLHGNRKEIPHADRVLKELNRLHLIIAQPQYNHRLALENTLINL